MASRTEENKILRGIVLTAAVEMGDFQNVRETESAMCAEEPVPIVLKCELSIIKTFHAWSNHHGTGSDLMRKNFASGSGP